ncbi:MAG: hypothetical protein H6807_11335 [Planctomycetes bacterium]|nr:hypothetical protein [Planctomycetota bacterium]
MDINEKDKQRFRLLAALYEITNGDPMKLVDQWKLGTELGLDRDTTSLSCRYLSGEGLIEPRAIGGMIGITHDGVREVEDAQRHPDKPTDHFPSNVINILNINAPVTGSAIAQGSEGSRQSVHIERERTGQIRAVLEEIKAAMDQLGLDQNRREELTADIESAQAQLESPKPKRTIVRECLSSVRSVLEGVAANVLAHGLVQKLAAVLGSL